MLRALKRQYEPVLCISKRLVNFINFFSFKPSKYYFLNIILDLKIISGYVTQSQHPLKRNKNRDLEEVKIVQGQTCLELSRSIKNWSNQQLPFPTLQKNRQSTLTFPSSIEDMLVHV